MTFWQFLSNIWEWLFLFALLFGGDIFSWIKHQLAQHRKHEEKMARLKLEVLREERMRAVRQPQQEVKENFEERTYAEGYGGPQQMPEIEISYHEKQ